MTRFKNRRLPKKEYLEQHQHRKSERPRHKKKNGLDYDFHSKDKNGNIICACCKMILVPNGVSNEEFNEYVDKLQLMGGVWNCCYDCNFSAYCNKCCFVMVSGIIYTSQFRTCGMTMMKQLLKPQHGGGRYSSMAKTEEALWMCLRRFFKKEMKYGLRTNSLAGCVVNTDKIMKLFLDADTLVEANKYMIKYKNKIKENKKKMILLNMDEPIEFLRNNEYRKKYYYRDESLFDWF